MAGALSVYLDGTVDPRVQFDRLAGVYVGTDWDMFTSGSVFVDFVTHTGMLIPLQFTSDWQTTGTGNYARVRRADYLLTTPSKWVEHVGARNSGDYYLHSQDVNEVVYTAAAYPKNQPWWLSWFSFNAGNEDHVEMECGWTAPSSSVSLRFRSSGAVEVYKDADPIPLVVGNIIDDRMPYATPYGTEYAKTSGKSRMLAGQRIDVALIPCRGTELLILSNQGGGFNYRFEDLDPNDTSPTICEAGRFWWYVPEGQAQVQLAPLRFATSGQFYSPVQKLRYAPFTGSTATITPYYGTSGYGSVSVFGSVVGTAGGAFTPDGTVDQIRLKMAVTGDGSTSPWLYGGSFVYAGSVAYTTGAPADITDYVLGAHPPSYNVPDSPTDVRFTVTTKSPVGMADIAPQASITGNRPVQAYMGVEPILTGRTEAPKYTESISDEARQMVIECRDYWKTLEKYLIQEPTPLDGLNLGTAISQILTMAGYGTAYQDIDYIDFSLPSVAAASQGEWALMPEEGDAAGEWVTRLHDDYAATYYMGFKPYAGSVPTKFFFKGTASLGTVAAGTIYSTVAAAVAAGWDPASGSVPPVYRAYDETTLEPEANSIWVMGQDPRTHLPVLAHYTDEDSKDPTLAPASRPTNWLGEERRYALRDPAITDQPTATWSVGMLRDRLTVTRTIGTWRSNMLFKSDGVPVWRGDVWCLADRGRYRILSFSGDHTYEGSDVAPYEDYTYVGEWLGA